MSASSNLRIIAVLFFFCLSIYAQPSITTEKNLPKTTDNLNRIKSSFTGTTDYRIIESNSRYIELELYPLYRFRTEIKYNNEQFIVINFDNSVCDDIGSKGKPDLSYRVFPVILPSAKNNSVTVIDYDVNEVHDINLAPIPDIESPDKPGLISDSYGFKYIKDPAVYSQNKLLPEQIAYLDGIGLCRELTLGRLVIHPFRYNPAARTLLQYTRVRVRVVFGQSPVMLTRTRSKEERELLKDIALNSKIALNWMNPELAGIKPSRVIQNSLMSTGDWYRIEIRDNGSGGSDAVYKMNKSYLESAGINLNNIDPRTIKMYGSGGDMLPDDFTVPRPQDMQEIAIYIEGESDGHFDPQDYILFYGKSVNNWKYGSDYKFYHQLHIYSSSNYYWICLNTPGNGRRMELIPSENVQNPYIPSSFTELLFFEPEINNLINEGNVWLSERKSDGQSFIWNNTLRGLEPNSTILYKIKPASRVFYGYENHMLLQEANSVLSQINYHMGNVSSIGYGDWIWTGETSFTINASQMNPPNSEQSSFTATFHTNSPDGEGYLDWMEIQYKRRFNSVINDFVKFYSPGDTGVVFEYNLSPFSNNQVKIFDATEHNIVKIIQPLNITTGNVRFQRSNPPNYRLSKFFAVGQNGYRVPTSITQRVPNQNLHGAYNEGASFVIITHSDLLSAANRLKAKREEAGVNYMKALIFDVQSIYNEFSGGVQDAVAIRDFLNYCYDSWQERPSYVCFLGDGSFDYKNIYTPFSNWVPAYEYSDPNINQTNNYVTDDFFVEVSGHDQIIDMAHGRIPARTLSDANAYLDKTDCYEDPNYNGYWKNRIGMVADDGDNAMHVNQAEELAEYHTPRSFEIFKMYLPLYPTIITPQGRRKPGVNEHIVKYWNEGLLSLHYVGHGSPEQWAVENVLQNDVIISQLNNTCRYPFVTVASCDYSKFDNPLELCGGELLILTPRKGAIGTLGATRPTDGNTNSIFFKTFWDIYMGGRDTLLYPPRFGKAVFITKQEHFSINDQKYELLCDPTLRFQRPRFLSRIDSINGLHGDTMRALSRINIYGSVLNHDSSLWAGYNGSIVLKTFDVPRQITIQDEDGVYYYIILPGGIIFSGSQRITNGKWRVQFIVPKDISYMNLHGKIIDYFYNNLADGSGLDTGIVIGGIDPGAPVDTTGPDISLYINTRNFKSGDVVNENFNLLADLYDESGINTTGTIGHKIEAVIDNNTNNKYDLTNFYNSDTTYKSGHLEYGFTGIAEGRHTLSLKAWDTYNNSSEASIDFIVSTYTALRIMNVYNYPNPFRDRTAFTFQHNYPGSINVDIKIYTVSGRLIKEVKSNGVSNKFVAIDWDGKDADGETLANGVYLYKLIVTADDGSSQATIGKMAVLK